MNVRVKTKEACRNTPYLRIEFKRREDRLWNLYGAGADSSIEGESPVSAFSMDVCHNHGEIVDVEYEDTADYDSTDLEEPESYYTNNETDGYIFDCMIEEIL